MDTVSNVTDVEDPVADGLTPLTHPAEGTPEVVTDAAGLGSLIEAISAGTGPIALDA